jgi:hypothetical protein
MELYTASKLMRKSTIYFFPSPKAKKIRISIIVLPLRLKGPKAQRVNKLFDILNMVV